MRKFEESFSSPVSINHFDPHLKFSYKLFWAKLYLMLSWTLIDRHTKPRYGLWCFHVIRRIQLPNRSQRVTLFNREFLTENPQEIVKNDPIPINVALLTRKHLHNLALKRLLKKFPTEWIRRNTLTPAAIQFSNIWTQKNAKNNGSVIREFMLWMENNFYLENPTNERSHFIIKCKSATFVRYTTLWKFTNHVLSRWFRAISCFKLASSWCPIWLPQRFSEVSVCVQSVDGEERVEVWWTMGHSVVC